MGMYDDEQVDGSEIPATHDSTHPVGGDTADLYMPPHHAFCTRYAWRGQVGKACPSCHSVVPIEAKYRFGFDQLLRRYGAIEWPEPAVAALLEPLIPADVAKRAIEAAYERVLCLTEAEAKALMGLLVTKGEPPAGLTDAELLLVMRIERAAYPQVWVTEPSQ